MRPFFSFACVAILAASLIHALPGRTDQARAESGAGVTSAAPEDSAGDRDTGREAVTGDIDNRDSRTGDGSGSGTALILGLLALAALILLGVLKRPHVQGQGGKS